MRTTDPDFEGVSFLQALAIGPRLGRPSYPVPIPEDAAAVALNMVKEAGG